MMTGGQFLLLEDRGVVTVGGADCRAFLQGLITNDIAKATPDSAIWAALLTPQGKYLHDFFIVDSGDAFRIDCEAERLMDLGGRLSGYKLRAEVDLGIGEGLCVVALFGKDALAMADLGTKPGETRALAGGAVYCDPRDATAGARAILPAANAQSALEALGFTPGSREDYDASRIALGLPDGSRDLMVGKAILLENRFDTLNGVDWDKGCYVGQELTARTHYRGLVKKRLTPVVIEGAAPAFGTQVTCDGRDAGEMRSSSGEMGLALLRLDGIERSTADGTALLSGDARLVPCPPDNA